MCTTMLGQPFLFYSDYFRYLISYNNGKVTNTLAHNHTPTACREARRLVEKHLSDSS
jgi:hypothetical protein